MAEKLGKRIDKLATCGLLAALSIATVINRDTGFGAVIFGNEGSAASADQGPVLPPLERDNLNETAKRMYADLLPFQWVDPDWAYQQAKDRGGAFGHLFGDQLPVTEVMKYYYIAGFRGEDLEIMTSHSGKESGFHYAALGDIDWVFPGDRSVGLSGLYCQMNGPIGCSGVRSWRENFDPLTNARGAYVLYRESWRVNGYGSGELGIDGRFKPWESAPEVAATYLDDAREAYRQLEEQYGSLE